MSEPNRAYPNEIAAVVRQQTFFIDSHLSPAASNDGYENAPLMMYGHFSRYRMFIINKDRKRAFANVPVQQMRGMIDLTKAIYPEYIKEKLLGADKPQGNEPEHPCYKVTFSSGNLKGMTPAQILVRDGDKGVEALRGQYKFLRDNLNKYPRNKAVMDAITDAVDLFKSGKLNADSASSGAGKHVTLYDVSLRPLVRQKRNDGMCFVYNCKITWDFTAAAPITIVIENYYAPVEKIEGGRLNVKASQRDASSVISNTMNLSVYVPGHEISEIVNEKEITHLKEPKIIALRQKTTRRYTLYINITAIFPLMGILGTVLSLITIAQDMTNIQSNFFAALTSTFWGLIFAIIYKMLDGVLASKIEDNEKNVELYLERNTVKSTGEKQKVTK